MNAELIRIGQAVEFLKDGKSFRIGALYLGADEKDYVFVSANSQSIDLKNLTKQSVLDELAKIKTLFQKMISSSDVLRNFVHNRRIEFSIHFDYGMGTIKICTENGGVLKWDYNLDKR